MKKEKLTIAMYECKKCNKTVYFRSNEERITKCKTCGQEMEFHGNRPYNPKTALNNVKQATTTNKYKSTITQVENANGKHIPKCPTCQSTNIRKIGGVERGASIAMWSLFSRKINKTFKCNNCGYTW